MQQTISQAPWAPGTTVDVYLAAALPAGALSPSGVAVATADVNASQAVTFTGLDAGVRYVALAGGVERRFLIPKLLDPYQAVRHRVEALEDAGAGGGASLANWSGHVWLAAEGCVGDGSAADRDAFAAALELAGPGGTVHGEPGKTYYLDSGTAGFFVPAGMQKPLRFYGHGCTLKLSAGCPTVFLQNRTADGQTFQKFEAYDFDVDGNNVGGQYTAAVFGSDLSTYAQKINLDSIRFENIRSYNVPTGTAPQPESDPKRAHYLFNSQDTVLYGATQYTVTNITCRKLKMDGGNFGILAVGQTASGGVGGDKNVFFDEILLEDCEHDTLTDFAGIPLVYGSNFQFGSLGHCGTITMIRCKGDRSGDVGGEINNALRFIARDCEFKDSSQANFLLRNYNATWVAAGDNIHRQHYTFDGCELGADLLVPTQAQGATNPQEGFYLATSAYDLGRVDIVNCAFVVRQQLAVGSRQRAVVGGARILTLDIVDRRGDVQANPTANSSPNASLALSAPSSGVMALSYRARVRWRGAKGGAFNFQPRMIALTGAGEIDVSADSRAEIDVTLTGASTGMIGVLIDVVTLVGEHGRIRLRALGDSTANTGVQVTPTNCSKFVVRGADFTSWVAGNSEWFTTSGAIRRAVKFLEPRRLTYPRATSFPAVAASPALIENTSGQDAVLMLHGGTITQIERTTDGGTTYESAIPATTAVPLMLPFASGEGWRVTYSVVPTARQTYVR